MRWLGKFLRFSFILGMFACTGVGAFFLSETDWHWSFYILASIGCFFLTCLLVMFYLKFVDPIGKRKGLTYEDLTGIPNPEDDNLNTNFESERDRNIRESQVVEERIKRKKEAAERKDGPIRGG